MRKIPANGGTQCREIQFPDSQEQTREAEGSNQTGGRYQQFHDLDKLLVNLVVETIMQCLATFSKSF